MEVSGLFLGLGNPGQQYAGTRHNFGFLAVDELLRACAGNRGEVTQLASGKKRYEAWKCRLPITPDQIWLVAKPLTFMNKSGEAAVALLQYYHIPLSCLVVAHDELDLPPGRMRFKFGGGAAGHNGIRSIVSCAGSPEFYRLRLGIGKPSGFDTTSFVLGRFSDDEAAALSPLLQAAIDGFFCFCTGGLTKAQQCINAFTTDLK